MKSLSPLLYFTVALGLCSLGVAAEQPAGDIHLPASDFHYKATKDYIEEKPVPEYQHASAEAYEAFKDMKYSVRIHWGLYSIAGNKPHESWPFLNMSFVEKQAYQELYKTWNPMGFNAEEWMTLFADNGLKMFAFQPIQKQNRKDVTKNLCVNGVFMVVFDYRNLNPP